MDKSNVVARINEILKGRGMNLNQLKDGSGISTTIYQWQRSASREATRVPSLTSIEKICNYLGISLSYFFATNEQERKTAKVNTLCEIIRSFTESEMDAMIIMATTIAKAKSGDTSDAKEDNRNE